MTTTQQNKLDAYADGMTKLRNILTDVNVPDFMSVILHSDGTPEIYTSIWRSDAPEERDHKLSAVGDAFGRVGWEATQTSITEWRWTKVVDGVKIDVAGAQQLPFPTPQPVPPNAFPLQLKNVEAV